MKQFSVNIPSIKVFVRNSYLMNDPSEKRVTEAYLIALTAIHARPLMFTVHLITGAMFSRLPINALICTRFMASSTGILSNPPVELPLALSQPFTSTESDCQYLALDHFKDQRVVCRVGDKTEYGHYLFTVDYNGPGLMEDPEQFKTHNILVLESGNLVALPNNHILFVDDHFARESEFPKYHRQTDYLLGAT